MALFDEISGGAKVRSKVSAAVSPGLTTGHTGHCAPSVRGVHIFTITKQPIMGQIF